MTIQLSFTYSDQWYFLFEPLVSEDIMNVQLMGKVNIDQGSSYTGQYLGINSNGQVEPMDINFTWSEF